MSDLSSIERLKFEALFDMESGYVLDFSNNTFSVFTIENVGIDIFDSKYEYGSNSKANRLRKFWLEEPNEVVGKLLSALLDYWITKKQISEAELSSKEKTLYDGCKKIVIRLNQDSFRQIQENTSSPLQKRRIFISYRRTDSAGYAGRIYDRLVARFGENAIFMDVDTIEGGVDFIKVLEDAVQSCDVLIALIGRQWLSITDKDGKRRLESPEDFVRIEIAAALKRNIRVIPVLVDDVDMPQPIELPESLKALARRNALQVNHRSFNPDVYRLIEHLEAALDEAERLRVKMKAQALQAAREKAQLETEEKARQIAAKEKADREAAEKTAREKAKQEAAEKARLEAEELARQKAAKEKADREAAEKVTREKAKRESQKPEDNSKVVLWVIGVILAVVLVIWLSPLNGTLTPPAPTSTRTPLPQVSSSNTPTKTFVPSKTHTKVLAPTATVTSLPVVPPEVFDPHPNSLDYMDSYGVPMRLVPAGNFTMGSAYRLSDEYPAHQVYLDAFYIDKYEVTNILYAVCVKAGECKLPQKSDFEVRVNYYSNNKYSYFPVIYVDWEMAKTYCEWRGAYLPTEAQWEKAARATSERTYPWAGNDIDCEKANYSGCIEKPSPIGNYENGKSLYGIYDLAGNVWEWTADWYSETYYEISPSKNPLGADSSLARVVRGGSWNSEDTVVRSANRNQYNPAYANNEIGFRCARDATP